MAIYNGLHGAYKTNEPEAHCSELVSLCRTFSQRRDILLKEVLKLPVGEHLVDKL